MNIDLPEPVLILILIAVAILGIYIILHVISFAITGAVIIFIMAAGSGFVGVALYVILWVLVFPLMLFASVAMGILRRFGER